MKNKIIDMGAGLERLSWITMGTPTSYDCSAPVIEALTSITGTNNHPEVIGSCSKLCLARLERIMSC